MQTWLTETIAPLKNNNFEIALFSIRTLKMAIAICVKSFRCQFLFTLGKISCFEHNIARVSFHSLVFWHIKRVKQLTALNKSFSVQNNIYCDCFAYYTCAYLRDVFPWRVTNVLIEAPELSIILTA